MAVPDYLDRMTFFDYPKICIWQPDYERNKSWTAVVGQF